MICVLDALDESQSNAARRENDQFLEVVKTVKQDANSRMKLLVLSRPLPAVTHSLDRGDCDFPPISARDRTRRTGTSMRYCKIVMEDENQTDIAVLIHSRLQDLERRLHPYAGAEQQHTGPEGTCDLFISLRQDERRGLENIRDYVADNTKGVILWFALVFEELFRFCKAVKAGVTIRDLEQKVKELPPELGKLYERIVEELNGKDRSVQKIKGKRNPDACHRCHLDSAASLSCTLECYGSPYSAGNKLA